MHFWFVASLSVLRINPCMKKEGGDSKIGGGE